MSEPPNPLPPVDYNAVLRQFASREPSATQPDAKSAPALPEASCDAASPKSRNVRLTESAAAAAANLRALLLHDGLRAMPDVARASLAAQLAPSSLSSIVEAALRELLAQVRGRGATQPPPGEPTR